MTRHLRQKGQSFFSCFRNEKLRKAEVELHWSPLVLVYLTQTPVQHAFLCAATQIRLCPLGSINFLTNTSSTRWYRVVLAK